MIRAHGQRPSIYSLYEQNIGVLTPLLAEQLAEAERRYPARPGSKQPLSKPSTTTSVAGAMCAVSLENWAAEGNGKMDRVGNVLAGHLDPDKYLPGKYAHLFRRN